MIVTFINFIFYTCSLYDNVASFAEIFQKCKSDSKCQISMIKIKFQAELVSSGLWDGRHGHDKVPDWPLCQDIM